MQSVVLVLALVGSLTAAACSPYVPSPLPAAPTSTTPGAQATLRLNASSRSDTQLDVSAQLLDTNGLGIPSVAVAFTITGGTVTPSTVTTDGTGTAHAIAMASGTVTLSATTGALSQSTTVIGGATPLGVTLSVPSIVINNPSQFTASVTGQPIGGAFGFVWTFGDGTGATTPTSTTAHAYLGVGSFRATVTVTDGAGRSASAGATAVVTDPPAAPAPTPAPTPAGLVVTLGCTPGTHGTTASVCNVSASDNGTPLASTAITGIAWDWGDGTTAPGGAPPLGSHTYGQAGTYLVTATVTATTAEGSKTAPAASKSIVVP